MDAQMIEDRYLTINKCFGQLIGVWPNQNKFMKTLLRFATFIILITSVSTMIARVVVYYSFSNMTDQVPFIILVFGMFAKQWNYIINESKLRNLLNEMIHDWLIDRPKKEVAILENYGAFAVVFSYVYRARKAICLLVVGATKTMVFSFTFIEGLITNICMCAFMFCLVPFVPPVLDVLVPLNESRGHLFIYPAYYFVDEEKYYYYILAHMLASATILACVFVGCDVNLMCTVLHACALLTISGQRFKTAADDDDNDNTNDAQQTKNKYYTNVRSAIEAHNRAFEYIGKIEDCHVVYLFLMLGVIIVNFTVTFVKLTTLAFSTIYFTYCTFIMAQLVHLFFLTLMGQFVINSNDATFNNICESLWYKSSRKTQFLYVLVLRRCHTPPKLTCGGLVELNVSSFIQILKASFSYYTVLSTV